MSAPSAYALAIVCEAAADRATAAGLADRVLCAEVDWLELEHLDSFRRWQGVAGAPHLAWRSVKSLADQRNIRVHGHFQGEPGAPDAHAARRALLLLAGEALPPDAVVLVRDTDGQEERSRGLAQARGERHWPFPVVLGVAHPKRECWLLAGFEPLDEQEKTLLDEVRREIGFDPRTRAEELSASTPGALRDAKRVLARLVSERPDREVDCWRTGDLETLSQRGQSSGLAAYLDEVRKQLVPLFRHR